MSIVKTYRLKKVENSIGINWNGKNENEVIVFCKCHSHTVKRWKQESLEERFSNALQIINKEGFSFLLRLGQILIAVSGNELQSFSPEQIENDYEEVK